MDVWPDAIPWSVILLFLLNGRSVETTGLGEQPYPQNIKVEALNTNYKLKWDWDFTNYANVTFSVQKLIMDLYKEWQQMMECANITINECDISHITVVGSYKFQVSALLAGTYRTLSDVLPFNPLTDSK
ncbi:hypothetical protein GDO86_002765 [Hymenochirus boettgeri]|uniref:Fibronectin type-III domain-containing protein n=1 Tax=Hymenochirus boettgeri TaxID=247094 RepID=A0A8T2K1L0_9PIPI|nr:hypothetical protein GDO86_002765 [Hymenochirus boettgeri]